MTINVNTPSVNGEIRSVPHNDAFSQFINNDIDLQNQILSHLQSMSAHLASAISDDSNLAQSNVAGALNKLLLDLTNHITSLTAHDAQNLVVASEDPNITATNVESALEQLSARISNIIASSGTSSTEVVDARLSSVYGSFVTLVSRLNNSDVILNDINTDLNVKSTQAIDLTPTTQVLSVTDSYEGVCNATVGGATLNQIVKNGDVDSLVVAGGSGVRYNIGTDGLLKPSATYNATHQTFDVVSGNKYFIKFKLKQGLAANLVYLVYSDGTTQNNGATVSLVSEFGAILTANKTLKANIAINESSFSGNLEKDSIIMIPLQSPYDTYTASQIDSMIGTYFEGLQPSKDIVVKSGNRNLFDEWESGGLGGSYEYTVATVGQRRTKRIACKPNTAYRINGGDRNAWRFEDKNQNFISGATNPSVTTPPNAKYMVVYYSSNGTHENVILNEGSTALPYEPNLSAKATISAKRWRVPSAEDTLEFKDGRWEFNQRVGAGANRDGYVLQSGDITALNTSAYTNLDIVATKVNIFADSVAWGNPIEGKVVTTFGPEIGNVAGIDSASNAWKFYTSTAMNIGFLVPKGTYANLAAAQADLAGKIKIAYELATPIVIDEADFGANGITVTGTLGSYTDYTMFSIESADIVPNVDIVYPKSILSGISSIKQSLLNDIESRHESDILLDTSFVKNTTSNITYYVRTDGNDSNDGSLNDSAHAFKTVQRAIDILPKYLKYNVDINVGDGIYSEDIIIKGFIGSGTLKITGNTTTPTSVKINSMKQEENKCTISFDGFEALSTTISAFSILGCSFSKFDKLVSTSALASGAGLSVEASNCFVTNSTFSNKQYGILSGSGSRVYSNTNTGTGNTFGILAYGGGQIAKYLTQPSGTTAEFTDSGGLITGDELTTTITSGFGVGWSGTITIKKSFDNLVEYQSDLTKSSDMSGTETLYTLPVGLRPKTTINILVNLATDSGLSIANGFGVLQIATTGVISIIPVASTTLTNARRLVFTQAMYYSA